MAILACIIDPAALHFDGNNVGGTAIVFATGLPVDVDTTHIWKTWIHKRVEGEGVSTDGQQFFIESADLPRVVHEVNLEYPVPLAARSIPLAHTVVVLRMDIQGDLVTRDFLMRKDANQMPGDRSTIFPVGLFRQLVRVTVKLGPGDLRMFVKILLALGEGLLNVATELVFQWIVAHYVSAAEIGLPLLKHGTKIEKDDVILGDCQIWRILVVGRQGIPARTDDAFVPISRNPVHAFRQRINAFVDFGFRFPWTNEGLRLDFSK